MPASFGLIFSQTIKPLPPEITEGLTRLILPIFSLCVVLAVVGVIMAAAASQEKSDADP